MSGSRASASGVLATSSTHHLPMTPAAGFRARRGAIAGPR
jgi:hypothetical protein